GGDGYASDTGPSFREHRRAEFGAQTQRIARLGRPELSYSEHLARAEAALLGGQGAGLQIPIHAAGERRLDRIVLEPCRLKIGRSGGIRGRKQRHATEQEFGLELIHVSFSRPTRSKTLYKRIGGEPSAN